MNGKERIKTAFRHQEADRVPVGELYINSPAASDILGRKALVGWGGEIRARIRNAMLMEGRGEEFYQTEVRDLVDTYRAFGLDLIIAERPPLKNQVIPTVIGENTWKFEDRENGFWFIQKYAPSTDCAHEVSSNISEGGIAEFERYVDILERQPIDLNAWSWDQTETIMKRCGEDMFIMAVVEIDFPPMSFASWGSVFLTCMHLRPDLVERYLDYRVRKGLLFVEKYARMGVDCIFCGEDWASNHGPLFSLEHFKHYFQPRFKKIIDAAHQHGMLYMKHTDGNILPIEKEFLVEMGIDAYQSIDPEAGMDLAYFKYKYGHQLTLMGNVDCAKVLEGGTPEDVVRETKRVIRIASPGGGHILSSSNTIHSSVPTKNFLAMLETARTYGNYPISGV